VLRQPRRASGFRWPDTRCDPVVGRWPARPHDFGVRPDLMPTGFSRGRCDRVGLTSRRSRATAAATLSDALRADAREALTLPVTAPDHNRRQRDGYARLSFLQRPGFSWMGPGAAALGVLRVRAAMADRADQEGL